MLRRIGQVVLAAPDIDIDLFKRQVETIGPLARPTHRGSALRTMGKRIAETVEQAEACRSDPLCHLPARRA